MQPLKVRTFIYCRLEGNQKSSGLQRSVAYLTSIISRQRSAISCRSLPERADFGIPRSLQLDRHTCHSQPRGLHRAMFSGNDSVSLVASIIRYYCTHLPTPKRWKAELAWTSTCSRLSLNSGVVGLEPTTSKSLLRYLTTIRHQKNGKIRVKTAIFPFLWVSVFVVNVWNVWTNFHRARRGQKL